MPRESFGLPSNSHLSNNSHPWEVLKRRLSDRNYEKMTKSIKSNESTNMTNMILLRVQQPLNIMKMIVS